jgi:hypothetical protein
LYRARWEDLTFKASKFKCLELSGSIHRHAQGGSNWQDFTLLEFNAAVMRLSDTWGLDPRELTIRSIEPGVNIRPPVAPQEFLERIILHRTTKPERRYEKSYTGIWIEHDIYGSKFYDKGEHSNLDHDLLRYEIRAEGSMLAKYGIHTLADLQHPWAWQVLGSLLLKHYDELLIIEPNVREDGLRRSQLDLVHRANDPKFWLEMERKQRSERRKALMNIYASRVERPTGPEMRAVILHKIEELLLPLCIPQLASPHPKVQMIEQVLNNDATFSPAEHPVERFEAEDESRTFSPTGLHDHAIPELADERTFSPTGLEMGSQSCGEENQTFSPTGCSDLPLESGEENQTSSPTGFQDHPTHSFPESATFSTLVPGDCHAISHPQSRTSTPFITSDENVGLEEVDATELSPPCLPARNYPPPRTSSYLDGSFSNPAPGQHGWGIFRPGASRFYPWVLFNTLEAAEAAFLHVPNKDLYLVGPGRWRICEKRGYVESLPVSLYTPGELGGTVDLTAQQSYR